MEPFLLHPLTGVAAMLYDLSMASLTKKIINGCPYFYARECKRVNGKPKIVHQEYLGRLEDIVAAVRMARTADSGIPLKPREALVTDFGAVVALYDLAQRLRLESTIDRHVPKQGTGPTVGAYLLANIINRCVAPCSKAKMGKWFKGTALRRFIDISPRQLSSQRYWDNMDRVTPEALRAIEEDVTQRLVQEFEIDLQRVLFDGTNFFTFIDTFNKRCSLAQRGKSKEGRKSLRIVGLALLVSADFHIPLFHRTYPGNQPDAPTFKSLISDLTARYKSISNGLNHVTIVFDKGNNSKENLTTIAEPDSPFHFVGSLVPKHCQDLLDIPADEFNSLEDAGLPDVRSHRLKREVFGVERTVVVTYNENLFVSQAQTLLREIAKRQQKLRELQHKLRRWHQGKVRGGRPPTIRGTEKTIAKWLNVQHLRHLFHVEITERDGLPHISYRFDRQAWERLQERLLGKNILFTDNDDWTDAEIVYAYRSQYKVENAFRAMKDIHHIAIRPQHHWTDQKIEVHVACCVLALMLCSLLQRQLSQYGIERSIPDIIDTLGEIQEVGVVIPPKGKKRKPTIQMTTTHMTDDHRRIFESLGLDRYLSR